MALTPFDAFVAEGLSIQALQTALTAFDAAWSQGLTDSFIYTIADFSQRSTAQREYIVDLGDSGLLYQLYVTHADNTADAGDPTLAKTFSNVNGSHQSSLGLMKTAETYFGDWGYSLRLDGLEPGVNDNVRDRAIVVHPWEYAREETIDEFGYLGLSWGCPAIDDRVSEEVINTIKEGSLLIIYFPDAVWLETSIFLP